MRRIHLFNCLVEELQNGQSTDVHHWLHLFASDYDDARRQAVRHAEKFWPGTLWSCEAVQMIAEQLALPLI